MESQAAGSQSIIIRTACITLATRTSRSWAPVPYGPAHSERLTTRRHRRGVLHYVGTCTPVLPHPFPSPADWVVVLLTSVRAGSQ